MTDEEHRVWIRERRREQQRERRAGLIRIDYADVSPEAAEIIDGLRRDAAGGDASSILNRIVTEWAAKRARGRKVG